MNKIAKDKSQKGIAAIIMVVVISAVSLLMAVGYSKTGLYNLETADNNIKGGQALAIAEGCVEDTLRILNIDNSYAIEGQTQNLGSGNCTVSVRDDGSEKIIESTGALDQSRKKIIVHLAISDNIININSWRESE